MLSFIDRGETYCWLVSSEVILKELTLCNLKKTITAILKEIEFQTLHLKKNDKLGTKGNVSSGTIIVKHNYKYFV